MAFVETVGFCALLEVTEGVRILTAHISPHTIVGYTGCSLYWFMLELSVRNQIEYCLQSDPVPTIEGLDAAGGCNLAGQFFAKVIDLFVFDKIRRQS